MKRVYVKRGDVFEARLDGKHKKYFQYVADDMTQLNSRVIRVFKQVYSLEQRADLQTVVHGEVDFHAHVVIRWGLQMGLWTKVGHVKEIGVVDVLFRDSGDVGDPSVKISSDWEVWRINEPIRRVGKLTGMDREADIGVVVTPKDIIDRMRTGKYKFVYPGF